MDIIAKVTIAGELQTVAPSENNHLKEPLYVRDLEVRTFICVAGEAKPVDLALHLVGKVATNFNPQFPWICVNLYPSSRKYTNPEGREFMNTDLNVRSIAPILNFD